MTVSVYDQMGDFYYEFVKNFHNEPNNFYKLTLEIMLTWLGDLEGKAICDLACGEGYLSRLLAQKGAHVTGVDLSSNLIAHARRQAEGLPITYQVDDAHTLQTLPADAFDIVVCNLAFMDIADYKAAYLAVQRVLKQHGTFLFSVLHPCFETPFRWPETIHEVDENGYFVACRVMHYIEEGHWYSGGTGMRGTHGAHHRMVSTYINALLASGFELKRLAEPTLPQDDASGGLRYESQIPCSLIVESSKR